jgi:hypothetical protein
MGFLMFLGFFLSGWQDSNLRPPAPKAGAITGLRYTPGRHCLQMCGKSRIYFLFSKTIQRFYGFFLTPQQ